MILAVTSAPCVKRQREARGSRYVDDCDFKKILELACTFLGGGFHAADIVGFH